MDLKDIKPNSTTHWLLFTLQNAAQVGDEPLTAIEVGEREPFFEHISTYLKDLHEAGGVKREKLDRHYKPYGYSITSAGTNTVASLGPPNRTPLVQGRERRPVSREFAEPIYSNESITLNKAMDSNGTLIHRNGNPHWLLYLLAEAQERGLTPAPHIVLRDLDSSFRIGKDHARDSLETLVTNGWVSARDKTDYKYRPKGYTLTDVGADLLHMLGAPTKTPPSKSRRQAPVTRHLPDSILGRGPNADEESLEPDWEWLEEQLVDLSQYELAAKARDHELTPREVYQDGGVVDILYAAESA